MRLACSILAIAALLPCLVPVTRAVEIRQVEVECSDDDKKFVSVLFKLEPGCSVVDPGSFRVQLESLDMDGNTRALEPPDTGVTPLIIATDVLRSELRVGELATLDLIIPAGQITCARGLVDADTRTRIVASEDQRSALRTSCDLQATRRGHPLQYEFSLGKADDDAETDPGVALDFSVKKVWGYGQRQSEHADQLSQRQLILDINGEGVTNDTAFADTAEAKFAYSYYRLKLPRGNSLPLIPAFWLTGSLGPEATLDNDDRDYVFSLQAEALVNFHPFSGSKKFGGAHPYVSLGLEAVDPDKRQDGTTPDSYERARAVVQWKLYLSDSVALDLEYELFYILDEDDALQQGLERWNRNFEATVLLFRDNDFKPFMKYSRGETKPSFVTYEEILLGLQWSSAP